MNKRGSAIVEAVMVFPIMLLAIVAVLYMMIYYYDQLEHRVDLHMALRAESGRICENMFYGNETDDNFSIYKKSQQIYSYGTVTFRQKGILYNREKRLEARKYLIDETKIVRMAGVADTEREGNEQ